VIFKLELCYHHDQQTEPLQWQKVFAEAVQQHQGNDDRVALWGVNGTGLGSQVREFP